MKRRKMRNRWLAIIGCIIILINNVMAYAQEMAPLAADGTEEAVICAENDTDAAETMDADVLDGPPAQDPNIGVEIMAVEEVAADSFQGIEDPETETVTREEKDWSSDPHFSFTYMGMEALDEGTCYELKVGFSFQDPENGGYGVLSGDTAALVIPEEWFVLEDTLDGEKLPVKNVVSGTIAEYAVKDGRVEIVFNENAEALEKISDIFGELDLCVKIRQEALGETPQAAVWTMQSYSDGTVNEAELVLPAREAEAGPGQEATEFSEEAESESETQELTEEAESEGETQELTEEAESEGKAQGFTEEAESETQELTEGAESEGKAQGFTEEAESETQELIEETEGEIQGDTEQEFFVKRFENAVSVRSIAAEAGGEMYASPVTKDIYWQDNNDDSGRIDPETYRNEFYKYGKLTFSYEVDGETCYGEVPVKDLLSQREQLTVKDMSGTGHYIMEIGAGILPAKRTVTVSNEDGTTEEKTVDVKSWGFSNPYSADGYYFLDVPDEATRDKYSNSKVGLGWYYLKEFTYTLDIILRHGDVHPIHGMTEAILENFVFNYKRNGADENLQSVTLQELVNRSHDAVKVEVIQKGEDKTDIAEVKVTIQDIPQYRIDGTEREYHVEQKVGENDTKGQIKPVPEPGDAISEKDYFAIDYVNTASSNHGTATDKGYSGATMFLTLTGETEYSGTKNWRDDDPEDRPSLEFGLWRYSKRDGADYTMASHVKNARGEFLKLTVPAGYEKDTLALDFTQHIDPNATMDVLLAEGEALPKYDSEGYEYVYFVREGIGNESTLNYEKLFGEITTNGVSFEITDTLPDGIEQRAAADTGIYNGGTVNNVLTGTVETGFEKTWKAMAYQDQIKDVTVEFTLQAKHKEKQGNIGDAWYNLPGADGNPVTVKLSGFGEEKMTDSYSASMPKYDSLGHELEYQWVETGVYQGEESTENLLEPGKEDGAPNTFVLSQNGKDVLYTSNLEPVEQEDGAYQSKIVNRIADTVKYEVDKKWYDENGEAAEAPDDASISLELWRMSHKGDEKLATLQLDGAPDEAKTPIEIDGGDNTITAQEDVGWHAVFDELPKYDVDGYKYDYIVLETSYEGYSAVYNTTEEDDRYFTQIVNVPGPSHSINVRKCWLDDGDEHHRGTVVFTVYEREEEQQFREIKTVALQSTDFWWKSVNIPDEVNADNILVLETSVAYTDSEGNATVGDTAAGQGYTPEKMEEIWQSLHPNTEEGAENPVYGYYVSDQHYYQVSNSFTTLEGSTFHTVTNKRLGHLDIDVTKRWIDGDGQARKELEKDLKEKGIQAYIKLSCDYEGAIDYGKGTVNVGTGAILITKDDGKTPSGAYQELNLADGKDQRVYFGNLPKYDVQGAVVHYSISEVYAKKIVNSDGTVSYEETTLGSAGIRTDFVVSYESGDYTVGNQHTNDTQSYTVVNKLAGTKDITYKKQWFDAYREQRNERPDIYLDIYQKVHTSETDTKLVSLYQEHLWKQTETHEDNKNHWTVNFDGLPKYDDLGYEIIYYAQEKMHVNGKAFDYIPVYYTYGTYNGGMAFGNEGGYYEGIEGAETMDYLAQKGSGENSVWLLKEEGTFVNQLANTVKIEGKKIWGNIPGGFETAALPNITFKIYQKLASETDTGAEENKEPFAQITVADWNQQYVGSTYKFLVEYTGVNTNVRDNDELKAVGPAGAQAIPLYDEAGNRYEYIVKEEIALNGTDLDSVYFQPVINNFMVQNYYNSDKGKLTVKKLWDLRELAEGEKYPTITFTLTRSYWSKDKDGNEVLKKDDSFRQEKQISYADFEEGEGTCTFENLEIYAPDGRKFQYEVTETPVDGYELGFAVKGNVDINGQPISSTDAAGVSDTQNALSVGGLTVEEDDDTPDATFKNQKTDERIVIEGTKSWGDGNNALGFRPTIEQLNRGNVITFEVSRYAEPQPGQNNGIGSAEARLAVDASKYEITWSGVAADTNKYQFMITGKGGYELEKYAPNGMPWIYYIQEQIIPESAGGTGLPGYNAPPEAAKCTVTDGTAEVGTAPDAYTAQKQTVSVANTRATTSVRVEKKWQVSKDPKADAGKITNDDVTPNIKEDYLGYSMEVEFTLQARVSGKYDNFGKSIELGDSENQNWMDTDELFTIVAGQTQDAYKAAFDKALENRLLHWENPKIIVRFTGSPLIDGNWKATFGELPHHVKADGDAYYELAYRLVESKVIYQKDGQTIYDEAIDRPGSSEATIMGPNSNDDLLYANVGIYNSNRNPQRSTWVNILPVTSLTVKKIWDDTNDAYGTRPLNAEKEWETKFVIQRKAKVDSQGAWEDVYSYNQGGNSQRKIITLTGKDGETVDNEAEKVVENLPQYGLRKNDQDTYERIEYEYRARELNTDENGTVIENSSPASGSGEGTQAGTRHSYNGIYDVAYADAFAEGAGGSAGSYSTTAKNSFEKTQRYAKKNWDGLPEEYSVAGSQSQAQGVWDYPVTLELKYKGTDGKLYPFSKPARVTLDGTSDTRVNTNLQDVTLPYGEYEPWKAIWKGVPDYMPDSELKDGKTVYEVVEITDGFYQSGPAADQDGMSEDMAFVFTNTPTRLKVSKEVDLGDTEDFDLNDQMFKFTLSNNGGVTGTYKAVVTGPGDTEGVQASRILEVTVGTPFELKHKESIVIYGLPIYKDPEDHSTKVAYTVTEDQSFVSADKKFDIKFDTSVSVNGAEAADSNSGSASLPEHKPETEDAVTSFAFTNTLEGAIHLVKKDGAGNVLQGVEFTITYSDKEDGTYQVITSEVCSNEALVKAKGVQSTNAKGELSFTDLKLGYYYKIEETKAPPGMSGLKTPVIEKLPMLISGEIADGGSIKPVGETADGKNIYVELKYEVANNSFSMPVTSGPGFFYPGLIGLGLAGIGCLYWMISNRKKRKGEEIR